MTVKVLNYIDSDTNRVLDTFVFKAEANITAIAETVDIVFRNEDGNRPYCDIIEDLYGHLLISVEDEQHHYW